jgi:DNA-binding CsgD family transcriptional regulator
VHLYETHFGATDAWYLGAKGKLHTGWIADGRQLCSPDHLKTTEFYNDFLRRFGWLHQCHAIIEIEEETVSAIALLRKASSSPFGEADLRLLRFLTPHLQRAVHLHGRFVDLALHTTISDRALDGFSTAVLCLRNGRVIFANRAAASICTEKNGIRVSSGELRCTNLSANRALQRLIGGVSLFSIEDGGSMTVERNNSEPLRLFVSRVSAETILPHSANAIVFVWDPEFQSPSLSKLLQSEYGLSHAEIRLVSIISRGNSLNEASEDLHVTYGTVRSQLKSIFHKTQTKRQSQLMKLVLTLNAAAELTCAPSHRK